MQAFKSLSRAAALVLASIAVFAGSAAADNRNLVTDVAGRVTVEFLFSDADLVNTLCVVSPVAACYFNTAGTNRARRFVVGTYPAGTQIEFSIQTSGGDTWSTDSADNSDNADHVIRTQIAAGKWRYDWEDLPNLGDADFNDIDVLVRIAGDSDGDGIWDDWETGGVDYEEDGVVDLAIQNAPFNAVVGVRDIFMEIDWFQLDANNNGNTTDPGDHVHTAQATMFTTLQAAFRQANSTYPDGQCHSAQVNAATGQTDANCGGINLHLDAGALGGGNAIAEQACVTMTGFNNTPPTGTDFDTFKSANFNDNRRGVFHYTILGHSYAAAGSCQCGTSTNCSGVNQSSCPTFPSCSSGLAELPGNDFIVTLSANTSARSQAGTVMHEFGHNLNLLHGGNENENYKPNYLSVMNYHHQFCGMGPIGTGTCSGVANYPGGIYDYSRASLGNLVETGLDETTGISVNLWNVNLGVKWACTAGATQVATGGGTVNWDCDATSGETGVNQNINPDWTGAADATVTSYFDWQNVQLEFQNSGSMEDGVHPQSTPENVEPPETMPEITDEICDGIDNDQDGSSDEGFDGDADGVADCKDNCAQRANADQLDSDGNGLGDACNRPFADAGEDAEVQLPPDACETEVQLDGTGSLDLNGDALSFTWSEGGEQIATGPSPTVTLGLGEHTIELSVSDGSSSDVDTVVVIVTDVTAPTIESVTATPACLNAPNHKYVQYTLQSGLAVVVSDACDPAPSVVIESVVSDQPDNGPNDGDTINDVVADDDAFCVRSERQDTADRTYTITVSATDAVGNAAEGSTAIVVPRTASASCPRLPSSAFSDLCTVAGPGASGSIDAGGPPSSSGGRIPILPLTLVFGLLALLSALARRARARTALVMASAVWLLACGSQPDKAPPPEAERPAESSKAKPAQPSPTRPLARKPGAVEFQVNSTMEAGQTQARIAQLQSGGFVAVFTDASQHEAANPGTRNPGAVRTLVRVRLFDASGAPQPQRMANADDAVLAPDRPGAQREPDVATRPDGGFVAVWVDVHNGVRAIRGGLFDADAAPRLGRDREPVSFEVSEDLIQSHMAPRVATFADGSFVVTWQACQASTGHCDARGRLFDADGEPRQSALARDAASFTLRPGGGGQTPAVAAFSDGRFVAVMRTHDPASGGAVLYRVYDSRANPTGPERTAVSWSQPEKGGSGQPAARDALKADGDVQPMAPEPARSLDDAREPAVAVDERGMGFVTWRAGRGDQDAIFGRSFDREGVPTSEVLAISTLGTGRQAAPSVVADPRGGFVVAWEDSSGAAPDGSSFAIRARRFSKNGPLDAVELLVNATVEGAQRSVTLAPLLDGRIIAVWTDGGRLGQDASGSAVRGRVLDL